MNINIGDKVRKMQKFPGEYRIGEAVGPILTVLDISSQKCVDGMEGEDHIIILSDRTWEFAWNLILQEKGEENGG
jgi:hypothetical protein